MPLPFSLLVIDIQTKELGEAFSAYRANYFNGAPKGITRVDSEVVAGILADSDNSLETFIRKTNTSPIPITTTTDLLLGICFYRVVVNLE